jgi:hypothetical protein
MPLPTDNQTMTGEEQQEQAELLDELLAPIPRQAIVRQSGQR